MRVFISAGEASGDAYGAALAREIGTSATFEGMGGVRMAAEGVQLHANTSTWGAISIAQSLAVVPRALSGYFRTRRALKKGTPGVFVPIDFGWVNIRLARHAKAAGWKVVYFIPPGSWRRDRQGGDLPGLTDAIVTPFPWSAALLTAAGANAHFFGHPIKQLLRDASQNEARTDQIAVLPGSRVHELEENLPTIAASIPETPVEFALAPSVDLTEFKARWGRLAPQRQNDRFAVGNTAAVLRRSRAGIVCSGTATLEAALSACPMVVIYRVSRSMELEAKIIGFKRPKYIALPNILLDRDVVPELIQDEATPTAIRGYLDAIYADSEVRERQLADFRELDQLLGRDDAVTRTAELIREIGG